MTRDHNRRARTILLAACAALAIVPATASAQQASEQIAYNIRAQDLGTALTELARQSRREIYFSTDLTRGKRARQLSGKMKVEEALHRLLDGTGLSYRVNDSGSIVVQVGNGSDDSASSSGEDAGQQAGISEILVVGSRSQNVDVRRTENDAQPYVVFGQQEIQNSQANNLEDFFRTRLPMSTVATSFGQSVSTAGNQSQVNLRGLGTNQTLILVDGRRLPGLSVPYVPQADINGIPLASIERIEVLPSTAGGIYGGGATGGVINIITKRDYAGVELSASYGQALRGDAPQWRIDLVSGFNLENGRTHVQLSASHSESDALRSGDRNFRSSGRALLNANNPAALSQFQLPFGATPNIASVDGSNLVLDDLTPLNSPLTSVPAGYTGSSSDGGAALIARAGSLNLAPAPGPNGEDTSLLPDLRTNAVSLSLRRKFTSHIDAYVDAAWNENHSSGISSNILIGQVVLPADAPNNPFTTPIQVVFPLTGVEPRQTSANSNLRLLAGVIMRLPSHWSVVGELGWGRQRYQYTQPTSSLSSAGVAALSDGTLDVVRDITAHPLDISPYLFPSANFYGPSETTLTTASLRASGPTITLPGGQAIVSAALERREERRNRTFLDIADGSGGTFVDYFPYQSQQTNSVYFEARAPIVGPDNRLPLVKALELQASVRYDEYKLNTPNSTDTFVPSRDGSLPAIARVRNGSDAAKYTVGLKYTPMQDLILRASYGTGFLPPSLDQLVPLGTYPLSGVLADPQRGNTPQVVGPFNYTFGGNPGLEPEESTSWSAGFVYSPHFAAGLRISLDYTHIHKTNEIVALSFQSALDFESLFPGRVTRAPLTAADQALGFTAGKISAIDGTSINFASATVEAYDLQVDYTQQTDRVGRFHWYALATYQPTLDRRAGEGAATFNFAGFNDGPLKWQGNAGVDWDKGPLSVSWNLRYIGDYAPFSATASTSSRARTVRNQGSDSIANQIYSDLVVTYRLKQFFGAGPRVNNAEISLGIQNLFDRTPPVIATSEGLGYSTFADPRLRRFTLRARASF